MRSKISKKVVLVIQNHRRTQVILSTVIVYTIRPDLTSLSFYLWGQARQLVYEDVVEIEDRL